MVAAKIKGFGSHAVPSGAPLIVAVTLLAWSPCLSAQVQDESRLFAGGLFGVSAVSPDAQADTTGSDAALSLYDPGLGPVLNLFAGVRVASYFSVQANWMWNRNDVTLVSSHSTPNGGGYYEQERRSDQHAFVLDGLIYFRGLNSAIRPYLGTGLSVLRFSSADVISSAVHGIVPPGGDLRSTRLGLRSHVGIDFRLSRTVSFRYSFSETISRNPISPSLTPPGRRGFMNFDNLFGFVACF